MLTKSEILSEVEESELDQKLFEELLEEHDGIRKAFNRKDYEKTLLKTGKFCETTYQLLQEIKDGEHSQQPDRTELTEKLENLPSKDYPESIRILIPRVANSMYDFRNKRGGAHISPINPQYIDAHLIVQGSRWIIAELLRVYGDGDIEVETLRSQVQHLATRSLPLVEEFEDGDVMVLAETESCKEDILMILYHFYPDRVTNNELDDIISGESRKNVLTSLNQLYKNKNYVHRNDSGAKLTQKGREHVEKTYGEETKEEQVEGAQ
ncbi:MAG: hypothetical protein H8Z69_01760 [Nanohaloarchaea archaeon]|nr:hypothetical protein [Candidatus Nanohaloarchaea archaeon]